MPTVIVLDVSLSMTRPLLLNDGNETTRKHLAEIGISAFLDQLSIHSKLEFISLVSTGSFIKLKLFIKFLKFYFAMLSNFFFTRSLLEIIKHSSLVQNLKIYLWCYQKVADLCPILNIFGLFSN